MADEDQDTRSLGRRIASRRIELGLTQGELAERLGHATPNLISRWERGTRDPRFSTLQQLASALGVTLGDLLEGVGREPMPAGARRRAPSRQTLAGVRPLTYEEGRADLLRRLDEVHERDPDLAQELMSILAGVADLATRPR